MVSILLIWYISLSITFLLLANCLYDLILFDKQWSGSVLKENLDATLNIGLKKLSVTIKVVERP